MRSLQVVSSRRGRRIGRVRRLLVSALLVVVFPTLASAGSCEHVLGQLEGWTVLSVTSIQGEFEGCDYGKKIALENGSVFTCAEYNYSYSYSPEVIVFAKTFAYQGKTLISFKLVIEDELFEMESKLAKN